MNNCSILSCCRYCFKTIIKIINLRTKSEYWIFNKKNNKFGFFQTVEIILIFLHLNIHLNLQFFQSKQMICFIGININLFRNYIFFKPMKIRTKSNSIFNLNQEKRKHSFSKISTMRLSFQKLESKYQISLLAKCDKDYFLYFDMNFIPIIE